MSSLMPWPSVFVDVGHSRLHVWVAGEGPPLLLLHGYPETGVAWRHVFEAFSSRYRCIAPDLPGWGGSTADGQLSLETLVDDVVSLIHKLDLQRPIIVGHDFGAAIAYAIGAYHPELARRIVTINFSPGRFQLSRPLHFYFFALPLLPELALRLMPRRIPKLLLRWWAHRLEPFGAEALAHYLDAAATPAARHATISYYRSMVRGALRGRPPLGLGPLRAHRNPEPAWDVIWGMRDPVATPRVLGWFRQEFPSVHIKEITEAGHFPHEETPEALLGALGAVLASHPTRSAGGSARTAAASPTSSTTPSR
jgi:pimeloyl-ACP methyl ester carboxylesterase